MKVLLQKLVNFAGRHLTHAQRRFVLDKLGVGALLTKIADDAFEEVALHDGRLITINRMYHAQMAKDGTVAYEDDVFDSLRDHLQPASVFYDIGANVGVFSFDAVPLVGESGAVLAFEPEPNNIACFVRTRARLAANNVTLHEVAVGAEDGTMTFDRRGGAFSGRLASDSQTGGQSLDAVPVRSIDSVVGEGAPVPTIIKIDVEGGEGAVLEGMQQTLKDHGPTVLVELHGFNPDGVTRSIAALRKAGYVFERLDGRPMADELDQPGLEGHVIARPG